MWLLFGRQHFDSDGQPFNFKNKQMSKLCTSETNAQKVSYLEVCMTCVGFVVKIGTKGLPTHRPLPTPPTPICPILNYGYKMGKGNPHCLC